MSIVINFYPKSSTKKKLQELLIMRDFFKVRYLNEVCDENKIVNYKWFEYHDYQSFTGVYASIIKLDESVKDSLNCSEWILHTKTQIGGSRFDKKKQNDIVREARKIFGGFFENDCFGKNRYTNINDYEDYSPPERGLFIIYENIRNKISLFQFGLENWHDNPWNKQMDSTNDEEIQLLLGSNNPDVILFN
ncbi:MAG: hypothetical protein RAO94_09395, partial [Candidatus Stygibacter australis]|nr:hypothetical protein [Candidatus Stygibacter australis]